MVSESSEFKGNILIFVDGYTVEEWRCLEHNQGDHYFFNEAGWAVGYNPRDRYCARTSHDKIRRFNDYDKVARYIDLKRKKYPNQKFKLIYEVETCWNEVSFLDDILAIDAKIDFEATENARIKKEFRDSELPCIEILSEKFGYTSGFQASQLLRTIRTSGIKEAKRSYSKSTYYRIYNILKTAELVD